MERKITFENMDHSDPIKNHVNEKLNKIEEILRDSGWRTPMIMEIRLKANKQHEHDKVELNLKTPRFNLNSHDENADMYVAIDNAIDKMIKLLKKEKTKRIDEEKKTETEKSTFADDKYRI